VILLKVGGEMSYEDTIVHGNERKNERKNDRKKERVY
jgi:hypothetical protein